VESRLEEVGATVALGVASMKGWGDLTPRVRWYNVFYMPVYRVFRSMPASLTYLSLPASFTLIWVLLIVKGFTGGGG